MSMTLYGARLHAGRMLNSVGHGAGSWSSGMFDTPCRQGDA